MIKEKEVMTRENFDVKYDSMIGTDTLDVLMRVASNLSDIQEMGVSEEVRQKLNLIKEYIFDYRHVLREEERMGL